MFTTLTCSFRIELILVNILTSKPLPNQKLLITNKKEPEILTPNLIFQVIHITSELVTIPQVLRKSKHFGTVERK